MGVQIEDRCRKLFVEFLGVTGGDVTSDASLEALGADSLDKIELIMAHEEEFGCAIPDDEAAKLDKFGDFVAFVSAHGDFG